MTSTISNEIPRCADAPAGPVPSGQRRAPERVVPAVMLAATVAAVAGFASSAILAAVHSRPSLLGDLDTGLVMACAFGFFSGSVAYQLSRLGWRVRSQAVLTTELDGAFDDGDGGLVVLVPAYKEEARVVRRTLLSAALQQCPSRRVVLLIDDPPAPAGSPDEPLLAAARRLPAEVEALLGPARDTAVSIAAEARARVDAGCQPSAVAVLLADGHRSVASSLGRLADGWEVADHEDALFVERVVRGLARINLGYAAELEQGHLAYAGQRELRRACTRLAGQLTVSVEAFERKRYANANHEPNKAMNLNVYLSLLGRTVVEETGHDGLRLRVAGPGERGRLVPDAAFVLTLDADSILLPDYSLRLLHHLRAAGNERLAVAQTPYSAIPGAPGAIERAAGATTDVQHLIHQGFTQFGATFWVGANAMLRVDALREIAAWEAAEDLPVARFIQDRTVIEDTESSIDLRTAGWQLYNYPARLAYSSTPPDFGSLLIQRRRWANGGLLILPKLLHHLRSSSDPLGRRFTEGFLRFYYLTSIAWVNIALIVMLLLPYRPVVPLVWLAAGSLPYFVAYGRDLHASGYRAADLISVYALNLVLVPVNLGGVLTSLYQGATGQKTAFARTPKVEGRTLSPPLYVTLELVAGTYLTLGAVFDLLGRHWLNGTFDLANLAFLTYGITRLIGTPTMRDSLLLAIPWRSRRTSPFATPSGAAGADQPSAPVRSRRFRAPGLTDEH